MKTLFPYFGGKSKVANVIWEALGQPRHYIEPFFGSGAVLFRRPDYDPLTHVETVCDANGHVMNVWQAIRFDSKEVAAHCDWQVNHLDLTARKKVLRDTAEELKGRLKDDAEYYDARLAGYWVYCASAGIGTWDTRGGKNEIPHISHTGSGIHAISLRPHGALQKLLSWYSDRLRYVRVVCGDWTRVCGGNWQDRTKPVGVFFDPPYSSAANRDSHIYAVDSLQVAMDVCEWCIERGDNPDYRIVLAGYYEEHIDVLKSVGWSAYRWTAQGGYSHLGNKQGRRNRHRETLFFSPHCRAQTLFA